MQLTTRPRLPQLLPRKLAQRLQGLRRDVAAATAGLRGRTPPVFTARNGEAYAHRTRAIDGLSRRRLAIRGIDRLTPDAVRIRFAPPPGVTFRPGQFLTLCIELDGVEHRRAYSLCSDPATQDEWAIGVKQTQNGLISTWLNQQLDGGELVVMGPSGSYGPTLGRGPRTVALVSGGSGITPHLAIAYGILGAEPRSRVKLVYANRDAASVMFRAELDALITRYPERFALREVLEQPPAEWEGGTGYLSAADVAWVGAADAWFVCGPTPMMDTARQLLDAADVAPDRIHQEHFSAAPRAEADGLPSTPQPLLVRVGNTQISAEVEPGQTLLEAGLAAGAALPYSCAMGGCGACRVRLTDGEVTLDAPNCLTDRERADGFILACVARPKRACAVQVDR